MSILLDTNAAIAVIKGEPPRVRQRLSRALAAGHRVAVSSIVVFELTYGVARSQQQEANAARLEAFLAGPLEVWAFDGEDARAAGSIRAELRRLGTPIGPYDLLIAGQALRHSATLVTANYGEFARVAGLAVED